MRVGRGTAKRRSHQTQSAVSAGGSEDHTLDDRRAYSLPVLRRSQQLACEYEESTELMVRASSVLCCACLSCSCQWPSCKKERIVSRPSIAPLEVGALHGIGGTATGALGSEEIACAHKCEAAEQDTEWAGWW